MMDREGGKEALASCLHPDCAWLRVAQPSTAAWEGRRHEGRNPGHDVAVFLPAEDLAELLGVRSDS